MMRLAPFFIDLGDPLYRMQLDMQIASAKRVMPDIEVVVLTDLKSDVSPYKTFRENVDKSHFTRDFLKLQSIFLKSTAFKPTLFTGTDSLFQKDIRPVFDQSFDMAVTWRRIPEDMPINTGTVFIKNKNAADLILEIYYKAYGIDNWFTDQIAYYEIIGKRNSPPYLQTIFYKDYKILFLSARIYNFAPKKNQLPARDEAAAILHFKGPRKYFMQRYWETYLCPRLPL